MRFTAIIPVILCLVSLILSFLCLFAGSSQGVLSDYPIVTLNSSRLGYSVFNTTEEEESSNPFRNFYNDLENRVKERLNEGLNDLAQELGIHDFYSAHVLNFCQGFYEPAPLANETIDESDISRNITNCSSTTALFHFDPRTYLQRELEERGLDYVDLEDLNWPSEVDDGLDALQAASQAMFVLYCIAIALIFVALVLAVIGVFSNGRISALMNLVVDWLAFLAIGIASALVTFIGIKAADVINDYGNGIGIEANYGRKFLALTWVATVLMFLVSLVWCFECIRGRRGAKKNKNQYEKS